MSESRYAVKMRAIGVEYARDPETAHMEADALLCRLLRNMGCGSVIDEYQKIRRWMI